MKPANRFLITTLFFYCLYAPASSAEKLSSFDRNTIAVDLSVVSGLISAWGISHWDWLQHSPKFKREGWFGADTHAGGADKTGHFYMSYVLSDALLWDFRRNGITNPERNAALSALAAMTLLEVGDATSSKYGFSHEDLIADAGGVLASWWLASNPQWDRLTYRRLIINN